MIFICRYGHLCRSGSEIVYQIVVQIVYQQVHDEDPHGHVIFDAARRRVVV